MSRMVYFLPSERGRDFVVVCLLQTIVKHFFCKPPGQPTPRITDRGVSTVTQGWVGDYNQRVPFRFHDGVVGFVDRRLPRIFITVGFSLQSVPEQGFYVHCAARNSSPRKLSRDV